MTTYIHPDDKISEAASQLEDLLTQIGDLTELEFECLTARSVRIFTTIGQKASATKLGELVKVLRE